MPFFPTGSAAVDFRSRSRPCFRLATGGLGAIRRPARSKHWVSWSAPGSTVEPSVP